MVQSIGAVGGSISNQRIREVDRLVAGCQHHSEPEDSRRWPLSTHSEAEDSRRTQFWTHGPEGHSRPKLFLSVSSVV